jgi:hypothetical protein
MNTLGVSLFNVSNTTKHIEDEIIEISKQYYTKQEVDEIIDKRLLKIHNYLELISKTFHIELDTGLKYEYKR